MYLLHDKSEVEYVFKSFYSMIKMQYHENIKILRSDNGTEFFNNEFNRFFKRMALFIKAHVWVHLNRMACHNVRIVIYWKQLVP